MRRCKTLGVCIESDHFGAPEPIDFQSGEGNCDRTTETEETGRWMTMPRGSLHLALPFQPDVRLLLLAPGGGLFG